MQKFLNSTIGIALLIIVPIINVLAFPLSRIPIGKKKEYEFPVRIKAIQVGCIYRDSIEKFLGNYMIFLSSNSNSPYFIYVDNIDLINLHKKINRYKKYEEVREMKKTIYIKFQARQSILCGYLPVKILSFHSKEENPSFSK